MEKLNIDIDLFSQYVINFIHDTNEFNDNNNDLEKQISPLKLQKLLYFVYVYALVKWDKKLWNNNFEKLNYGPVIRNVYDQYVKYRNNTIEKNNNVIAFNELTNIERLELEALILELNQKFDPIELSNISHAWPWENAKYKQKIKDKDILNYYSKNNNDRFINEIMNTSSLESNFKFLS